MKSPELVKLCQSLREILRAAVAANQDQEVEVAPATPGEAAGTAKVTELPKPWPGGTP
jgi:hypothetical protein